MFEAFRDERRRRAIEKRVDREFNEAADVNDQHKMDDVYNQGEWELNKLRWQIQKRETDRLLEAADRFDIVVPDVKYERSPTGNILPTVTRSELRKAIDTEKMRRREVYAWWWKTFVVPTITLLIGLLGAATGLVAIWKRH